MMLLEDNVEVFKKAEQHQQRKAELVEFNEDQLNLLKEGFDDMDMVSIEGSSIVSYDTFA